MKFAEGDKVVTDSIDIVTKSVVKYKERSETLHCRKLYRGNDKSGCDFRVGSVGNVSWRCVHLYRGNKDETPECESTNAGAVYRLF